MLSPPRPVGSAFVIASLLCALWMTEAQAHAKLVKADPPPRATVASPKMIHLEFSEEIAKKFSTFKLTGANGDAISMMAMGSKDAKSLDAMPHATLAPGRYTVSWTAVSTDDGHKTTGTYSFAVK